MQSIALDGAISQHGRLLEWPLAGDPLSTVFDKRVVSVDAANKLRCLVSEAEVIFDSQLGVVHQVGLQFQDSSSDLFESFGVAMHLLLGLSAVPRPLKLSKRIGRYRWKYSCAIFDTV
jgi:hypothetical protein